MGDVKSDLLAVDNELCALSKRAEELLKSIYDLDDKVDKIYTWVFDEGEREGVGRVF